MRRALAGLFALAVGVACAAPAAPQTTAFTVGGMVCHSCEEGICAAVMKLDGVLECKADHAAGAAEVRHDPSRAAPEAIAAAITRLGYTASPRAPSGR